jgi:hypothetical protein
MHIYSHSSPEGGGNLKILLNYKNHIIGNNSIVQAKTLNTTKDKQFRAKTIKYLYNKSGTANKIRLWVGDCMKSNQKNLRALSKKVVSINEFTITWLEVAWVLFLSSIFILFIMVNGSFWLLNALIIPATFIGYKKNNQLTQSQQKFLLSLALAIILTYGLRTVSTGYKIISQPPTWDFHLYWIYGQVGSRFLNPYDQSTLIQFAQTLKPSEVFLNELYFFQFPSLIFLFLPLGWFDINTAAFLWFCFLAIVLILDIIILWSIFYDKTDYKNLILVALLTLTLEATHYTLMHTQINFIVLLAFLMYWQKRESITGGIWLGIGMIVKPILAIVLIYPVLRKHWRPLLGVVVAVIVSSAITIMAFGPEMFFGYFANNPIIHKMPNYLYTEDINQSLLATILRQTNFNFSQGSPYMQPIFICISALITGITSFLIFPRKEEKESYPDYALALTITFALLLFPKTLTHYAVMLIVPILIVWTRCEEVSSSSLLILIFVTAEYVLVSLKGVFVFISILSAWLFIAGICIKLLLLQHHCKNMNHGILTN